MNRGLFHVAGILEIINQSERVRRSRINVQSLVRNIFYNSTLSEYLYRLEL